VTYYGGRTMRMPFGLAAGCGRGVTMTDDIIERLRAKAWPLRFQIVAPVTTRRIDA